MIAWKLFRQRKDGTLGPLFINKRQIVTTGHRHEAESHPTKGFAVRPGWHCTTEPNAPHLKLTADRVWRRVEISGVTRFSRPSAQGGEWLLARRLKVLENG